MLTRPMLQTLWPRAKSEKIDGVLFIAADVLKAAQINTPLRLAHLMAQISHENGAGTIIRENMNYSASRMLQIFGGRSAYVTPQEASVLAGRPQAIAERVYGLGCPKKAKDLGNTQSGDGYRYRGNGDLQLTGRASHRDIGKAIGVDLENNPEILQDSSMSFKCAVAEFVALNCLPAADADNLELVTRRVNGGTNGLSERRTWLHKWKVATSAENAQVAEAPVEQIDEALTADAMPRVAEAAPTPMSESTIAKGGAVVTATAGGGFFLTIWNHIGELPSQFLDAVMKLAVDKPEALLFALCGSGGVYVIYRRWFMKKNEGV